MRTPRFGGRLRGLLALGLAPLLSLGAAIAVTAWGPGADALNRLYAGLFTGVLLQGLLLGVCLLARRPAGLTLKRALSISHGWAGAALGAMLFIICISGALAVLKPELRRWEMPSERSVFSTAFAIDDVFQQGRHAFPLASAWRLEWPDDHTPTLRIQAAGPQQRGREPVPALSFPFAAPLYGDLSGLLSRLHSNLYAGFPGRILVSLFGFGLTLLVLGGLVLHPRQAGSVLRLRRRSGLRTLAYDSHKLAGLWLLPLLLLIATTGIFSGLGALGTVQLAPYAFPDQPGRVMQELMPSYARPALGQAADMASLDELLRRHHHAQPGFQMHSMTVHHWGDSHAYATVQGTQRWQLSTPLFERYHYALADLSLLHHDSAAQRGLFTQGFIAIQPLHFAQYAGPASRWLHALGGLAAALLAASGVWLWLQRHTKAPPGPRRAPWLAGLMLGLMLACCTLFAVTALSPDTWPLRARWQSWSFALAWISGLLACLLPVTSLRRRSHCLLRLSSLLLLVAASASLLRAGTESAPVDLAPLLINLILLSMAALLWQGGRQLARTSS